MNKDKMRNLVDAMIWLTNKRSNNNLENYKSNNNSNSSSKNSKDKNNNRRKRMIKNINQHITRTRDKLLTNKYLHNDDTLIY